MERAYWTASECLTAMEKGQASAVSLLQGYLERIEKRNPPLNAVIQLDAERALAAATAADRARQAGDKLPLLHGLPMTIKESFEREGLITCSGAPRLQEYRSTQDADAVAQLRQAGAVIFGKTNLPLYTGDLQSYNEVYGTTNNPWDVSRIPGGSSGGAAAALAAGFTPLELGSDIGGSIRNPAHFCGVLGHKPSFGLVPMRGHIPPKPGQPATLDIAVAGPMALSVEDLELAMQVLLAGNASADRFDQLPAPRGRALNDFRVAVWPEQTGRPIERASQHVLDNFVRQLSEAGADIVTAMPDIDVEASYKLYYQLLSATLAQDMTPAQQQRFQDLRRTTASDDSTYEALFARGATITPEERAAADAARTKLCADWNHFFQSFDILLCPVTPTAAFVHDHSPGQFKRTVQVDGQTIPYLDQIFWAGIIGIANLPSTVVPAGRTSDGLPVGIQIIANDRHDRSALAFADAAMNVTGGFIPPPGYT